MAVTLSNNGITYSDGTVQNSAPDSSYDFGQLVSITTFTSSGTYTAPTPCRKLLVKVQGGGGGSAGHCEGGGAGGYSERLIHAITPGMTFAVTIGGGGGGVGYYAAAGDGGTSSFGSYCSASGGYGANRNYSHTGGHGGTGSGGQVTLQGGGGIGHTNGFGSWGPRGVPTYWGGSFGTRHSGGEQIGSGTPGAGASPGTTGNGGSGKAGRAGMVVVYAYS
jgi:hypothetical protein